MTMSWVAEEKPSITAAMAIMLKPCCEDAGSTIAMPEIERMIMICDVIIQLRRRPSHFVNNGKGRLSTKGAQINLRNNPVQPN